jgi:hypothetical protein
MRTNFKVSTLKFEAQGRIEPRVPKSTIADTVPKGNSPGVLKDLQTSEFYLWANERFKDALKECTMTSEADGLMLITVSVLFGPKFLYNE